MVSVQRNQPEKSQPVNGHGNDAHLVDSQHRGDGLESAATFAVVVSMPPEQEPSYQPDLMTLAELGQRCAELEVRLEVAESERWQARAALQTLNQPVIITDPFEDVVLMSNAAAELFGVSPEQAFGPLSSLIEDEEFPQLVAEMRAMNSRGAQRQLQRSIRIGGELKQFDLTLICFCDPTDGRPSPWGAVTLLHPVAPIQAAVVKATPEVAQVDFTGAIAHELRTPLTSLKAYTELLLEDASPDEGMSGSSAGSLDPAVRQKFLKVISSEVDRMSRLVDVMQLLAKIDAGQVVHNLSLVSPVELLQHAVGVMTPQAMARRLTLTMTTDIGRGEAARRLITVKGDRDLLLQAVLNGLSNAVKYTQPGGKIDVVLRLSDEGKSVEVLISDSGVGIDSKDVAFVFDKFYRSSHSARLAPGSGLGLPLVKRIIETVHGGRVCIESVLGEGTRLSMTLPVNRL